MSDENHYFGWVTPSRTEPDSEKFDFAFHDEPFPPEVVSEFEEIVGVVPRIRPTFIDFLVLRSDYAALLELPRELHGIFETVRFPLFDCGTRNLDSHVLAERRLSSFLNSASAFRDRMLRRLDSPSVSLINNKISEVYDSAFGYRLCYNLRNFSQHRSNPLNIIPVNAARDAAGNMQYRIDLELDRDRLIGSESKFQPKVKAELRAMGDKIPLMPNCTDYYRSLRDVFAVYLSLSGADIRRAFFYETVVRRRFPHMPADATPLMFRGRPKKVGAEFKTQATSFSFDELERLEEVVRELVMDRELVPALKWVSLTRGESVGLRLSLGAQRIDSLKKLQISAMRGCQDAW